MIAINYNLKKLNYIQMRTYYYIHNIIRGLRNIISRTGLFLIAVMFTANSFATILIDPAGDGGFSNGSTFGENGWTVANYGSSVNQWVLGTAISTSPFSGNSAYISIDGGITNTYNTGSSNSIYFYRDVTIPAGENVLTMTFNWGGFGESVWDMIQVWTAPTTVVPTGEAHPGSGLNNVPPSLTGATWQGSFNLSSSIQSATLYFFGTPGTTIRIIFAWKSDTSVGTMPAGSVDNISLSSGNTLPTATANSLGGLWSSPETWSGGVVPPNNTDVIIPAGAIVTVNQVTSVHDLTIDGTLQWNATANAMTLSGDLTINSGGKFLPYSTGQTAVNINIAGDFTNNGYANLAANMSSNFHLNFNGSGSTLGGSGVFEGNGTKGIIRSLAFQNLGSNSITTSQDLILNGTTGLTNGFAHTAGSLNTNGHLTIDNTAQLYGRPINTQVASVHVTSMGSLYDAAPVVFGTSVLPWASGGIATLNSRYFSGGNVYLCTVGGTFGGSNPVNTSPVTEVNGTATLLWIGPLGTLGNPFQQTAVTLGTQYFCGNNLYTCIVAGTPSASAPPTCVSGNCTSGTATFRYAGSPARVSVNYDGTSQTVRSLNLVSAGGGYASGTAPTLVFSVGIAGGTGSGAVATSVIFYSSAVGPTASVFQKGGGAATISGGLTINSDQGTSLATSNTQASSGVGALFTTGGGTNYTVAPQVAFAGPTALNLITNPGSGYTVTPTITVSGGTLRAGGVAYTSANFLITVNQGTVQSVYLNTTAANYIVPPTLTMSAPISGTTATLAFPSGCWPSATPVIGSNGQILSFTMNNNGYGYVIAPICAFGSTSGTPSGGTYTTAATAPTARVGLYNLNLNFFSPGTLAIVNPDDAAIPANRKINILALAGNGNGLNLSNNLTLYGTAPFSLVASLSTPGNILDLGGNNLNFTWNGYAGATNSTFNNAGTNCYVRNGSITNTGRGGAGTFNYPFAGNTTTGSLVWFVGSTPTAVTTGCNATKYTVTELSAPSNSTFGSGAAMGSRSYRAQFNSGTVSGLNPTVRLHFNSLDGLSVTQDQTFVGDAAAQSGPWSIRSAAYGASGALPAAGSLISATVSPGPIIAGDRYYGFVRPATTVTSFSPTSSCGGGTIIITGSGFTGATSVTFGGVPALSFEVNSSTEISALVDNAGGTGLVSVTTPAGTGTSAGTYTFQGAGPIVSIQEGSSLTICPGATQTLTALPTGNSETYLWSSNAGDATTQSVVVSAAGTYSCTVTGLNGCFNTATVEVIVNTPPAVNPTAVPSSICVGATSQLDAGTFVSGTLVSPTTGSTNNSAATGFDITNISAVPVTLHYFSFQSTSAAGTIANQRVYKRLTPMNCVMPTNVTTDPSWILVGTVATTSNGPIPAAPTVIPLDVNVTIPPGVTYAFAVGGASQQYWNGTGGCPVTATTAHLTVKEGWGGTFTSTIASRRWHGEVTYSYGDPNLTYSWSPSGELNSSTIINPVSSATSTTLYTMVATNSYGCSSTADVTLEVTEVPTAPVVTGTMTICGDATTTLTSNAPASGNSIRWFDASTGGTLLFTGASFTTPVLSETTTYYVEETAPNCSSTRTAVTVNWTSPPTLAIYNSTTNNTGNVSFCGNSIITVVNLDANSASSASWAANGSTFSWSESHAGALSCSGSCSATNSVDLNNVMPNFSDEQIVVTVSDPVNGCVTSASMNVTAFVFPTFTMSSTPSSICGGATSIVSAGIAQGAYGISSIAFAPVSPAGPTTPGPVGDDVVSGAVSIGFNFQFYGNTYSQLYIGTNGFVTFNSGSGSGCCSGEEIPSTSASIQNFIAANWTDGYSLSSGSIDYFNLTSPNRFVVRYNSTGYCCTNTSGATTSQIILYESGMIEIHNTNIALDGLSSFHLQTQGIMNNGGTLATVVSGRNGVQWNATNDAYRFSLPVPFNFLWSSNPSGFSSTLSVPTVSPTETTEYTVLVTDPGTGCTQTGTTTVNVQPTPADPTTLSATRCGSGIVNLSASGTPTLNWYTASSGGTLVNTGSTYSPSLTGTTTYYVESYNGACLNPGGRIAVTGTINIAPTASASASPTAVCPGDLVNLTGAGGISTSLSAVLSAINTNSSTLIASVPTPSGFNMDLGVNATNISDGCSDMYDGGNFINTNIATSISYSDNAVTNSASFGAGGAYFTRYLGPGGCQAGPATLWYWVADINGLTSMSITGNNGADGSGLQALSTFNVTANGVTYNCFYKRVYNAFDPSINQIFMIREPNSVTQSMGASTDDNLHSLSNLTGVTRVYYMLFAGANGADLSLSAQSIAQTFANIIPAGSVTLSWTADPSGTINNATSANATANPMVNTTYTFAVTGSNGCTTTATAAVTMNSAAVSASASPSSVCHNGSPVLLSANYSGPDASFVGTGVVQVGDDWYFDPAQPGVVAGNNEITFNWLPAIGCQGTTTFNVNVLALPVPNPTNNGPKCEGTAVGLFSAGGMTSYSWTGPNGFSSSIQNPSFPSASVTVAIAGTYTLRVTGANTCTNTATSNLVIHQLPTAQPSIPASPACAGTSVTLVGNAITTGAPIASNGWIWTGPGYTSTTTIQSPVIGSVATTNQGNFTLRVRDTHSPACLSAAVTVPLVVHVAPVFTASPVENSNIAAGIPISGTCGKPVSYTFTITGTPTPAVSYVFSGATTGSGSGTGSGSTFYVGVTNVTVTATNVCATIVRNFTITVDPIPVTTALSLSHSSRQYSDMITMTATLPNGAACSPQAAATATFSIGSPSLVLGTVPFVPSGANLVATLTVPLLDPSISGTTPPSGPMAPGNHSITVAISTVDAQYAVVNTAVAPLTITQENTTVEYSGTVLQATASANSGNFTVILSSKVYDISATDLSDVDAGDIRNARVMFVNRDAANAPISGWLTPVLIDGDPTMATVDFTWASDIGNATDVSYTVGIIVNNGYYLKDNPEDNVVVTVYKPAGDRVTAGGSVRSTTSAGTYASIPGRRTHFGMNVKFNANGSNLQGQANIMFVRMVNNVVRTYQIKVSQMISLGVNVSNPNRKIANYVAKANLKELSNNNSTIASNCGLFINIIDNGEPGVNDSISIALTTATNRPPTVLSNILYTTSWISNSVKQMILNNGNLLVHSGFSLKVEEPEESEAISAIVMESSDEIMSLAYPNPFTESATILFTVPENDNRTTVEMFTVTGSRVATLFDMTTESGTEYRAVFDAATLAEGIYTYRITSGSHVVNGKLVLIK
jgi:hypothetical protein